MYPYIEIFNRKITSYGLCMVIAFFLVTALINKDAKKKNIEFTDILILVATTIGSALLGAKVLFLLVSYSIPEMIGFIMKGNFEFIANSGLVFYGGLLCGIPGAFLGAKLAKLNLWDLEPCIVPYIPLGHSIGRIGCLLSGCCYGFEYSGPLAVYYKNSLAGLPADVSYFPVQGLEALLDIFVAIYLVHAAKKEHEKGDMLFKYLFCYAILRFITECMRGDVYRGIYLGLSTAQWISIGLLILCAARFIFKKLKKNG